METVDDVWLYFVFTLTSHIEKYSPMVITLLVFGLQFIRYLFQLEKLILLFQFFFAPVPKTDTIEDTFPPSAPEIDYPLVAVQLPMMNEIRCFQSAITSACKLDWPSNRLIIQVLDDSTDEHMKALVDQHVQDWSQLGKDIRVYRRPNRDGHKAGNLKHGMAFLDQAEYVAIFDVDFEPKSDFLKKTIPSLIRDPKVAFVQARWTFVNAKESLLTRLEAIRMNFHHKFEQATRYRASLFFIFNGSAGVWRTGAMKALGGWHTDTCVEDIDLSLRAYLNGWRGVYLQNVECASELPSSLSAFFSQYHRWISGYVQVARKMLWLVYRSRRISWYQKFFCFCYLCRFLVTLTLVITILVVRPFQVCTTVMDNKYSILNYCTWFLSALPIFFTPDEIHLFLVSNTFSNAIVFQMAKATLSGIFDKKVSNLWIVTPKSGHALEKECRNSYLNVSKEFTSSNNKTKRSGIVGDNYFVFRQLVNYVRLTFDQVRSAFRTGKVRSGSLCIGIYLLIIGFWAVYFNQKILAFEILPVSVMHFCIAFDVLGRPYNDNKMHETAAVYCQ